MRKLTSIIIVLVLAQNIVLAQGKTFETRIADILTEMPASNLEILNKQMGELVSLGEKGILKYADMLTPPEKGGDVKVRFALGNLSKYITSSSSSSDRLMVSNAYLAALQGQQNKEISAFLIQQIQLVSKDEAVDQLSTYLSDNRLCEPATQALTAIGSAKAGEALSASLSNLSGKNQITVVKALGVLKVASAEGEIAGLTNSSNPDLTKVSLFYLANLPTLKHGKILESAAETANFDFEPTRANASYLLYASRLAEKGELAKSEKICKKLIGKSTGHTSADALSLLVSNHSKHAQKYLKKALTSEDIKVRGAALHLGAEKLGDEPTSFWLGIMKDYPANVQAEIITMLGNRGDVAASAMAFNSMNSNESAIQVAAIGALAKLNPEGAVDIFIGKFQTADSKVLESLKETMLWLKSDRVAAEVAKAIPQNNGEAKIALMEILAEKRATDFKEVIYAETTNSDAKVRLAALNALASVSEKSDQQKLFSLFQSTSDTEELKAIQNALLAVAMRLETPMEKKSFLQGSQSLNVDKTALFLEILPELGGTEALDVVNENFNSGNAKLKKSAFTALTNWKGLEATSTLYDISENDMGMGNQAAMAFLQQVNNSDAPDAQKLLLIRKIMGTAASEEVERKAIQSIGQIHTFTALTFVKNYLDDNALKQDAARSVMRIALPGNGHEGLTGAIVRQSLENVIDIIEGGESDYDIANIQKYLNEMPEEAGFVSVFNGKDLSGWKGLVENPIARAKMSEKELAKKQAKADEEMTEFWSVKDGVLWFNGKGHNLCTDKKYGDFEMLVDWRISKNGDSGIYLRGTPQVQVWDTSRVDVGAQVGSGGLYNNQKHERIPLVVADNPIDDWNTFHITMIGDKVTVYLNGQLVVDNVVLENYWDRTQPIFPVEQIELQAHGNELGFRDIYIKDLSQSGENKITEEEIADGFTPLFQGDNLDHWVGNKIAYVIEDGQLVIYPEKGGHGNLFTAKEYADFNYRFEFKLTPGANNGLGIRAPLEGDAAYVGTELQILDNTADIYKDLQPYQYHGSAYGIIAAKRGYLKPVGEWNSQEVIVKGDHVKVILNGTVILDGNMIEASKNGTADHKDHPGLKRKKGHIGYLGHGSIVYFRNIRIKEL